MSTAAHESRRRFLRRVGTTIAAGLGAVAFGADRAGAARRANSCMVWCTVQAPCSGDPTACNQFVCSDECTGTQYSACLHRPCASFCRDTVCV